MATIKSPAGTMQGYSLKVWVARNKDTLKYLLMGASGALANLTITNETWKWVATFAVPILIKLLVDAIDFWTSDVVL